MGERISELLREAALRLGAAGVETPAREARLLMLHALGLQRGAYLDPQMDVEPTRFRALVARRAGREPMALITGTQGFWTLELAVSGDTLVPRADSETLIEAAVARRTDVRQILDLGTGTGALLLAALAEFPAAFGVGVDISPRAAAMAAGNAQRNGLAGRAAFIAGDWASAIAGRFDLVLCNPPYIESADIAGLMPEVARFEPARALDGGADGLAAYRALIPPLPRLLAPGGAAVFELGAGQGRAVAELAAAAGLAAALRADLAGIERAIVLS
jgi:release factor glutamine methyltransferase